MHDLQFLAKDVHIVEIASLFEVIELPWDCGGARIFVLQTTIVILARESNLSSINYINLTVGAAGRVGAGISLAKHYPCTAAMLLSSHVIVGANIAEYA